MLLHFLLNASSMGKMGIVYVQRIEVYHLGALISGCMAFKAVLMKLHHRELCTFYGIKCAAMAYDDEIKRFYWQIRVQPLNASNVNLWCIQFRLNTLQMVSKAIFLVTDAHVNTVILWSINGTIIADLLAEKCIWKPLHLVRFDFQPFTILQSLSSILNDLTILFDWK